MSIYICSHCKQRKDNDYHPCSEDPYNELELICDDCLAEHEERIEQMKDLMKEADIEWNKMVAEWETRRGNPANSPA